MALSFDYNPPDNWESACQINASLFSSCKWQQLLNIGLNSCTLYGWNDEKQCGVTITVFKAGPFRVGYVGFPAGVTLRGEGLTEELVDEIKKAKFPCRIDVLRFLISPFLMEGFIALRGTKVPETAILNLQSWQQPSGTRRNVRKFQKSGLIIKDIYSKGLAIDMYSLYANTVIRHNGNIRYTKAYFENLVASISASDLLRCIGAFDDQKLIGFVVVGIHGKTAYYLHGATNINYTNFRVSDGLYLEMILWAKEKKLDIVNFMSSPQAQMGLIKYKEKWGGVTEEHMTYEIYMNKFMGLFFGIAYKIISVLRLGSGA